HANEKLPKTLLNIATSVITMVFGWSWNFAGFAASSTGAEVKLVACVRRDRRLPVLGYEIFAFGPKRHVLARFLGEAFAVGGVENSFPHHAPDNAWPEVILSVKTLHPIDQLRAVESGIDHGGELMPHFI